MRNLRLREAQYLPLGGTAGKVQSWDLKPYPPIFKALVLHPDPLSLSRKSFHPSTNPL